MSGIFDEPNLVSAAGLVPVLGMARDAGLRQLDAVPARILSGLAAKAPPWSGSTFWSISMAPSSGSTSIRSRVTGSPCLWVRALNALLATLTIDTTATLTIAQRLRKGESGSPRGVAWNVADALATVTRLRSAEANSEPPGAVTV